MKDTESYASNNIRHHRNILILMVISPVIVIGLVTSVFYLDNTRDNGANAQASGGKSLTYLDDARNALLDTQQTALVTDIRGDGNISTVSGGVRYTSNSGERSEHYIGSHTKPLWSDTSSGWFAFDFTLHDNDSSWRVIEQEHEGDMSPTRALEAGSSTLKLTSRYGTPHVRGPDKSWTVKSIVPGQRIQIVGYEKFGQGNAVMQAWWRPYGNSTWTQFADSSGFSMGYTSGNPGRYHKRGTYHGNHSEVSSVTWYGTALMFSSRSGAETAAGINGTSSPSPTPPPPAPSPTPPPPAPSPSPTPTPQSPYSGAISLPGKLQAENYDKGGQGVAYNDTTNTNQGGKYRTDGVDIEAAENDYSVGWVNSGEWLEYTTTVAQTGKYDLAFRIASGATGSGSWQLKQGSTVLAAATSANTGGWYTWKDVVVKNVSLNAGSNQVLRLEATGPLNLNHVTFTKQADNNPNPVPVPAPTPPPSPSLPTQPLPPISIPGASNTKPVAIPDELVAEEDGSYVADFNGDGLNEIVRDINNDGSIDPANEIIIEGSTNTDLTDTSLSSLTIEEFNDQLGRSKDTGIITLKPGPLPEVRIPKPVAYTFLTAGGVTLSGIGIYLALTKLAIFAAIRGKWNL